MKCDDDLRFVGQNNVLHLMVGRLALKNQIRRNKSGDKSSVTLIRPEVKEGAQNAKSRKDRDCNRRVS